MRISRLLRPDPLLGLFVSLQTFLALSRSGDSSVLFWWDRAAAPVIALTWAKDVALAALAGVLAARLLRATRSLGAGEPAERSRPTRGEAALLASAILLGEGLRWVWADLVPPGVWLDVLYEARALLLHPGEIPWIGGIPLVLPGAHEIVSFFYLHACDTVFGLFGRGDLGILAISAIPGTLTIPAAGWLAYEAFGARAAAIAAALVALSGGPLILSRWGYTPATLVPLALVAAAALLAAFRRGSVPLALLSGAATGLALHTHSSAVTVLIALGVCAAAAWRRRERRAAVAAWAGAAALAFLPWGWGFVQHPGFVGGRLRDVNVGAGVKDVEAPRGVGRLELPLRMAYNGWRYSGFFLFTKDPNPRHTLPGRRVMNPVLGAAALLGIVLALERLRDGAIPGLILLLAGGSLAAGVFSDAGGAPNTVRACILAALAFVFAAPVLARWCAAAPRLGARPGAALALILAVLVATDAVPFLCSWPDEPFVAVRFCFAESSAGRLRRTLAPGPTVLEAGVLEAPLVFATLAASPDPRRAVVEPELRTAEWLAAHPPAEPVWFVGRRRALETLRAAGLKCARGVAVNGVSPDIVLARVRR